MKQFILDLICSGDGDIPLYLRVGDGNESDSAMFATIIADFQQQWRIDALFVADAALYTEENLQQMKHLRWVARVPATRSAAKLLLENIPQEAFLDSSMAGYRIAPNCSNYSSVKQRWVVVESQARQESDLKQLEKRLAKQFSKAESELRQLCKQEFACSKDAQIAAERMNRQLPLHQLDNLEIFKVKQHSGRGRPRKDTCTNVYYHALRLCCTQTNRDKY